MTTPQQVGKCTHCNQPNSVQATHCEFCGLRLPWAQESQVSLPVKPKPHVETEPSQEIVARKGFLGMSAKDGGWRQAVIATAACGFSTALPYALAALFSIRSSNSVQRGDSLARMIGFGIMGAIFGGLLIPALGRKATTFIMAPVLFALSLYFMLSYG